MKYYLGAEVRSGSIATGSSRQQVRSCPLCPESGSEFGVLAALPRAVAGSERETSASNHPLPWRGQRRNGEGDDLAFRLTASLEVRERPLRTKPRPSGYRSLQIATAKLSGMRVTKVWSSWHQGRRALARKTPLDMQPFGCLL